MTKISTIGLDLAKHVFQVRGVDEESSVVLRKKLRRGPVVEFFAKLAPCTVGALRAQIPPRGDCPWWP
jgi:transposase